MYEKDDVLMGKAKIALNIITYIYILVTNLSFTCLKDVSIYDHSNFYWHTFVAEFFFLSFFQSCFSMCRKKSMCLLQHNGSDNAVFVSVAASRNDQAHIRVPRSAVGHLSLNH